MSFLKLLLLVATALENQASPAKVIRKVLAGRWLRHSDQLCRLQELWKAFALPTRGRLCTTGHVRDRSFIFKVHSNLAHSIRNIILRRGTVFVQSAVLDIPYRGTVRGAVGYVLCSKCCFGHTLPWNCTWRSGVCSSGYACIPGSNPPNGISFFFYFQLINYSCSLWSVMS